MRKILIALLIGCFLATISYAEHRTISRSSETRSMATDVANWIDANLRVPNFIAAPDGKRLSPAQHMYIMARWIRNNYRGFLYVFGAGGPTTPSGNTTSGEVSMANMETMAEGCANFIDSHGRLPNFVTIPGTNNTVSAEDFYYMLARTIRFFHLNNGVWPSTVRILNIGNPTESWIGHEYVHYPWSRELGVPLHLQQTNYWCGPASGQIVMAWYGSPSPLPSQSAIASAMGTTTRGTSRAGIRQGLVHFGYPNAAIIQGWDNLRSKIAARHPQIFHHFVCPAHPRRWPCGSQIWSGSFGHYAVVRGLTANLSGSVERVRINDPTKGDIYVTTSSFDASWNDDSGGVIRDRHMITAR